MRSHLQPLQRARDAVAHDLRRHRPRLGAPLGEGAHALARRRREQRAGDDFGRAVVVGHVEAVEAGRGVVGQCGGALLRVERAAVTLHVGHLPQAGDQARDLQARRQQRARCWAAHFGNLRLHRHHVFHRHLADGDDFTVGDAPGAERADDVAVLVELHRADDAHIAHRLLLLDQLQRARKALRPGIDHLAAGLGDLADRIADGRGLELARMRDGQPEDGAGIEGAVGRRRAGIEAAAHRRVGLREELGRRRLGGARRGAEGVVQELRAHALDEVGRVHAVVEQEALRPALLDPGAHDGRAVAGVADEVQRRRVALQRVGHLGRIRRLLRVVGRDAEDLAAQRLVGAAELGQHVDAEVVVDVDDGQCRHALVHRVLGGGRALQRVAGDGAEEPAVALAFVAQLGQRRRGRGRRDLHHAAGAGDRGDDRDRHAADDAADDGRRLLQVDQLARLVHRHRALALRVAQVEGQLAAGDAAGTGGLVQLVEGQLHRLRRRLAEAAGRARERHHHARGVRAGRRLGGGGPGRGQRRDGQCEGSGLDEHGGVFRRWGFRTC